MNSKNADAGNPGAPASHSSSSPMAMALQIAAPFPRVVGSLPWSDATEGASKMHQQALLSAFSPAVLLALTHRAVGSQMAALEPACSTAQPTELSDCRSKAKCFLLLFPAQPDSALQ